MGGVGGIYGICYCWFIVYCFILLFDRSGQVCGDQVVEKYLVYNEKPICEADFRYSIA